MRKGALTRDQAIEAVGVAAVEAVERENCEPTNRGGYNGRCNGDGVIEWAAAVACEDRDGDACLLRAYYYTDDDDETLAEEAGWDSIEWEIAGYEVV